MPPSDHPTNKNSFLVPLAIVLAGGLVAAAVYWSGRPSTGSGTQKPSAEAVVEPVGATDHLFGNAGAEITVIEYSDLECPFCKAFHSTMHAIVDAYGGKVSWVYRHFPIVELHSKAPKEAEASECAYDQGGNEAFWKFIDKVFETTGSNDSLDPAELPRIASSIGLDTGAFNTCLSSGKHTEDINKDVNAAVAAGARGTPYSVILGPDGKRGYVNGAEDFDTVKARIDALLK